MFVFEIRCSETIKYIESISRSSISDWYTAREVFTVFKLSNVLPGRDPSSQCSEASGLQAPGGIWDFCLGNGFD